MTKEKIQLTENEIDKLYNNGKITLGEAEFLRKGGDIEDNGISRKIRDGKSDKKREIIKLYKEGGLSISDTIAYESNLLIERNRKNTSTIVTIIAINIVLAIIGVLIISN